MNPGQKPPTEYKPGVTGPERRRWPEARIAFDSAVRKSTFAPAFDRMVAGTATVESVLTVLMIANEASAVPEYSKELLAMRSRFRELDVIEDNEHVAGFLKGVALLIPALKEPIAVEVITGLGLAAYNDAYFDIVDKAVDAVLGDPESLSDTKTKRLRDLRATIDSKRGEHEENRTVTRPEGVDIEQEHREESRQEDDDQESEVPYRSDAERGALVIAKTFCGIMVVYLLIMIAGATGHRDESAPQPKTRQPVSAPVQAPPAQKDEPNPVVTVLDVPPSAPQERRAPRPRRPKRAVQVPDASPPVQSLNTDAGESPESIAERIINPNEGAKERLAAMMNPDAGVQEERLVGVLKVVAAGNDDELAVIAIDRLNVLARQSTQPDSPARKALESLASDASITSNPARSSAIAIPKN